jgi:hypothetical protein
VTEIYEIEEHCGLEWSDVEYCALSGLPIQTSSAKLKPVLVQKPEFSKSEKISKNEEK